MKVEVISSGKVLFSGEAASVKVPGELAPFTILKGHIPIVSTLVSGNVQIEQSGKVTSIPVSGGFVEVANNSVLILLSDDSEKP